jgi:uncharacterized SAM-binding protein YcdF (DUF218 family)
MTLEDSAALKSLLLPPAPLLIAALAGWLLRTRWPSLAAWMVGLAIGLLYALSTPMVAGLLMSCLQTDPPLDVAEARRAAAIVVLSGDLSARSLEYGGDTVGGLTLQRLRYAARLQHETALPVLVTGGRFRKSSQPLAILMADTLTSEFGVPVRWTEDRSQSTFENATFTAALLKDSGIHTILLVTHAWHMPRAKAAFAAAGFDVIPAPTEFHSLSRDPLTGLLPNANALAMSSYAVHELIGLAWYRLAYI